MTADLSSFVFFCRFWLSRLKPFDNFLNIHLIILNNFRLYQVLAELVVINQADSCVLLKRNQNFLRTYLIVIVPLVSKYVHISKLPKPKAQIINTDGYKHFTASENFCFLMRTL
nr:MAG TPA: hypothetical protein [Caudoviricetes sp.]